MEAIKRFLHQRDVEFYEGVDIRPYLTFKIGGLVKGIIILKKEKHLREILPFLKQIGKNYILLGKGSNIVFTAPYTESLVLINRISKITNQNNHSIKVSSGTLNSHLLSWNVQNNIGGMEFLAGIPGTIGGAAAVNAGAFGRSMDKIVAGAEIFSENGQFKNVDCHYFTYQYRVSAFKFGKEIILNLFLKYHPQPGSNIQNLIQKNLDFRQKNHPPANSHSAGCFFKNPLQDNKNESAGKILEELGFKGFQHKGLSVSNQHANFIINRGSASFSALASLEKIINHKVIEKKGLQLQREVIYVSKSGGKY